MDIKAIDNAYVANTYARQPLQIVSGKGACCYDETGKKYIDLGSGIAVNAFGFADDIWQKAVAEQAGKLQHCSNYYYTEPCAKLAQMLCEITGMKKVFFGNSGAEANEGAIKAARRYSFLKYGEGRKTIITLKNSFHGRTLATLTATGQDSFHTEFGPFPEGFVYCEPDNLEELKTLVSENACCGIMMETIQGEGGVHVLDKAFVEGAYALCREHDLCLIMDEVQTGNARTGKYFGYMHYDVVPDIVTTAKGIAGGLPLGAFILGEKTENALAAGTHGSTFGGNPICCAAAISIVERLDEAFMAQVTEKGEYIRQKLENIDGVCGFYGRGLMIGIDTEKEVKYIISECLKNGLLVLSAKDRLRLLPPLSISYEELDIALDILKGVLSK